MLDDPDDNPVDPEPAELLELAKRTRDEQKAASREPPSDEADQRLPS